MSAHELDNYVAAFERAIAENASVDLADFVPDVEHPQFAQVLIEIIRADLEFSWDRNERKTARHYQERFPEIFENPQHLEQIAFEEYRLRILGGEQMSPFDFAEEYGIDTKHWPLLLSVAPPVGPDDTTDGGLIGDQTTEPERPDLAERVARSGAEINTHIHATLHRRLRFISIVITFLLAYFAALVVLNPIVKVGLFLGSTSLVVLNACALLICICLTVLLWARKKLGFQSLRIMECILFGLVLLELAVGLYSDLFFDHELVEPLAEGDHSLFHYSSSWSLPFFALITVYGILIPSSWWRCTIIVTIMAAIPLAICVAAAIAEQGMSWSFFQSFLLQMFIWMSIAVGVAIYGVHRIDSLQRAIFGKKRLGNYQLVKQLARGGMGEVYLAEHTMLKRTCAVKMMRPDCAGDAKLFSRFQREVQVLAGLSHPNAVQIFDYGHTEGGTFYYVMEFLDGRSLHEVVRSNGVLDDQRTIKAISQVCSALNTLHQGGLIHRDITPGNIFVCNDSEGKETIKLLDFGLVKVASATSHDELTQDGMIIGTPAFMSPEQARGHRVDARTDIYSLGAVAYFLRAGQPPFTRSSIVETLNAHIRERYLPLDQHCPDIDPQFANVIDRCLAKDPQIRFADIPELLDALSQVSFADRP